MCLPTLLRPSSPPGVGFRVWVLGFRRRHRTRRLAFPESASLSVARDRARVARRSRDGDDASNDFPFARRVDGIVDARDDDAARESTAPRQRVIDDDRHARATRERSTRTTTVARVSAPRSSRRAIGAARAGREDAAARDDDDDEDDEGAVEFELDFYAREIRARESERGVETMVFESDAEDEYERIAARMEARMEEAFEAAREAARRRASSSSATTTTTASSVAFEAVVGADALNQRVNELEERLRSATTSLRATQNELDFERRRCAELTSAVEGAKRTSTEAIGDNAENTRALGEEIIELEREKAESMRERARLLEVKHALEEGAEQVRVEAQAVREIKERIESENEVTHAKMRDIQRKFQESEEVRRRLAERLRAYETTDGETPTSHRDDVMSLREDLEREKTVRERLESELADLALEKDSTKELCDALREEVEALRRVGSGEGIALDAIEPNDDVIAAIPPHVAQSIEAHLNWRHREARGEPGDARSDWAKAESVLTDRLARADGQRVAYWAFLRSLAELMRMGDVGAFDENSWRVLGNFVGRAVIARDASVSPSERSRSNRPGGSP